MQNAADIASRYRIQLRNFARGNHRVPCPQCSSNRKKRRDPCLSVDIDERGVRFHCWHCPWSGGEFFDQKPGPAERGHHRLGAQRAPHQPQNFGGDARRQRYNLFPGK